jgi:hypothetical protein
MPVGIFKVLLGWLIDRHNLRFRLLGWLLSLCAYRWCMLITRKDPVRHQAATGCGLHKYVGCFVVVVQHMMKLEAMELVL